MNIGTMGAVFALFCIALILFFVIFEFASRKKLLNRIQENTAKISEPIEMEFDDIFIGTIDIRCDIRANLFCCDGAVYLIATQFCPARGVYGGR